MKRVEKTMYNRTFAFYVGREFGSIMLRVVVYEVIQNRRWWQFKERYMGDDFLYVDDFESVDDALLCILNDCLVAEKEDLEREKKLEEFF